MSDVRHERTGRAGRGDRRGRAGLDVRGAAIGTAGATIGVLVEMTDREAMMNAARVGTTAREAAMIGVQVETTARGAAMIEARVETTARGAAMIGVLAGTTAREAAMIGVQVETTDREAATTGIAGAMRETVVVGTANGLAISGIVAPRASAAGRARIALVVHGSRSRQAASEENGAARAAVTDVADPAAGPGGVVPAVVDAVLVAADADPVVADAARAVDGARVVDAARAADVDVVVAEVTIVDRARRPVRSAA